MIYEIAFPQEIDKALPSVFFFDSVFKCSDTLARDSKHIKKCVHKGFRLGVFVKVVFPFLGKLDRSRLNFVPA